MRTYVFMHVFRNKSMYVYMYVCVYIYVRMYRCMYEFMFVRVCGRMYVCTMYVRMNVYT